MNESEVQARLTLSASKAGWRVWRNNVGVLPDARGVPIRFGLANVSKQVNSHIKSGDLIGIRPVVITPDMVGQTIGQFVSLECKRPGWKFNPNDERDVAQKRWADLITSLGGYAKITMGEL